MAKNVGGVLLLIFALSSARPGGRAHFKDEQERRWNTPPELTPESVVGTSDNGELQTHLFSPSPVTATINLNAVNNNAHSISLGAGLDGIGLSESNSYSQPAGYGINSLGQAAATSFGVVNNGQAITGAVSSTGISQSSAATDGSRGQYRQYSLNRPTWSNVGPNNRHNDRRLSRPTLTVSRPYDEVQPLTLNIDGQDSVRRDQKPTIYIYKWRPNHRIFSRPSLSIEHRELRPYDPWNGQTHGSTSGLRVEVNAASPSYGASTSNLNLQVNASPSSLSSPSTGQVHTSRYAESYSRSLTSRARRSASSDYVSGNAIDKSRPKRAATSKRR